MSSATLALIVLVTVILIAGLVIRLLRPRRREGPASENSAWISQAVTPHGPSSYHDVSFHSPPIDASSHGGIDSGGHGGAAP
jgi:hypothetical protein